jgi:hypothetical protein
VYWDHHELIRPASQDAIVGREWEWADFDERRLVWAAKGKLRAAFLRLNGLHDERVLHDFNSMKFEALEAPY